MPSSSVFDIAQHPSGMMWFVTKSGPAFYDAKNWYSFPDSLGLPSSDNSKIVIVDSTVWVAGLNKTSFTIQKYQNKWSEISFPFDPGSFNRHISFNVFKYNEQHYIAVGSGNRLFICDINKNKWEIFELNDQTINSIHSIDGKWLICTTKGLWEFIAGNIEQIPLPYEELPSDNILTLELNNKSLHLLGFNWYAEIQENKIKYLLNDIGLTSSSISNQSSIVVDKEGKVIYGASTPARIINRENNSWQNLLIKGEKLNIGSTRIFCDQENNIWISDTRGLFKFNVLKFLNYNKTSGLADNEVTAITQLQSGEMILANPYDFNELKNNTIKNYNYYKKGDLTFRILSMAEDTINNLLYVATNAAGLLVYHKNNFREPIRSFAGEKFKITSVKSFNGKIYAAGNGGIFYVDNARLKKIDTNNRIRNIAQLGNHLAFLSHSDGVFMFDGNSFKHYSSENLDLRSVYQAVIFKKDTLLATRDGMGIIKAGKIQRWDKISIKSPAYGLLVDQNGQLWIGGDQGIYIFNGETLQQYDLDEGLSGNEINRNAIYEDDKGQVWIGTEGGASVFLNNSQFENNLNLKVQITNVKTEQGLTLEKSEINQLSYNDNSIQISFQCLSYFDEDKINFRYSIHDSEVKWIKKTDQPNNIFLTNLESGDYTFKVQARYGTGEWGPLSSFQFTIKKPFFMQWWFIVLVIITLIICIRIIFHFRYLYLIKKQKNLKMVVAERTREVTILNQQLEEKVKLRTKELKDKNLKLEESAYMNAHHLRGPLTKIMSALLVVELEDDNLMSKEIYNILKDAVNELDAVIYSINDILIDK